jgi:hypothetical protein
MIALVAKRKTLLLLLFGCAMAILAAIWVRHPGYMDAEYYYATARTLAGGGGFQEPFIWNYLDDPAGIPHPSHLYWLPVTSILAAIPMSVGGLCFRIAQLPFILLTGGLPLMAATLSAWLGFDDRMSWFSGLLAGFSGFYLAYFITTDAFSLYAALGGGILWLSAASARSPSTGRWLLLGGMIGVANLTRTDGLLFIFVGLAAVGLSRRRPFISSGALVLGFLVASAPWLVRNWMAIGAPFSPATSRAPWMLSYNELFAYPASQLTFSRWWHAGIGELLSQRWEALVANLSTLLAVNGLVFQAPLILIAAVRLRRRNLVKLAGIYLLLLLGLMSLAFPFAGARGGFFHSSAALMPLFWALTPKGVAIAVDWASRVRRWDRHQARMVFQVAAVALSAGITMAVFWNRALRPVGMSAAWSAGAETYEDVASEVQKLGFGDERVAVNNPPGFYLASGMPAIVIPNGGPSALGAVMQRYGARIVILDQNHPEDLELLYDDPTSLDWLKLRKTVEPSGGGRIYILESRGVNFGDE